MSRKKTAKERVLSYNNIYYAYHSLDSYLDRSNLTDELIKEYNNLGNKYNEKDFDIVINNVKARLEQLFSKDKQDRFVVDIVRQLKTVEDETIIYRYVHRPQNLIDLISMVAILRVFIKDISTSGIEHNSTLAKSFPSNFYGSIPSDGIDSLYEPWTEMYSKYQEKYIDSLLKYKVTNEYKYEINLDFKNFFPTINPYFIIEYIYRIPEYEEMIELLEKLLILKVNFLKEEDKENYYKDVEDNNNKIYLNNLSVGLPQGLPQSYFFANVVMTIITPIINASFKDSKSIYYVDDSVIFANDVNCSNMEKIINQLNIDINAILETSNYNQLNKKLYDDNFYKIKIHKYTGDLNSKTTVTEISKIETYNIQLYTLSKNASNLNWEIFTSRDINEEESLLNKAKALMSLLSDNLKKYKEDKEGKEDSNIVSFRKLLERVEKFYKYRKYKLENSVDNNFIYSFKKEVRNNVKKLNTRQTNSDKYNYLEKKLLYIDLIYFSKLMHDSEIDSLKGEIVDDDKNDSFAILRYLLKEDIQYKDLYSDILSLIKRDDMLKVRRETPEELISIIENLKFRKKDKKETTKKPNNENNPSNKVEVEKDTPIKTEVKTDYIISFEKLFRNSLKFKRIIYNAIFSFSFNIEISNQFNLMKKDGSKLTYKEARIMAFIRNNHANLDELESFIADINKEDDMFINDYRVDYKIFEVLPMFIHHIRDYKLIDNLIKTHHFVYSLWSNGSILFNYYTLHNEIHSIEIIKTLNSLTVQIDSQSLNYYEKYLLYLSAYLHDISMATMPAKESYDELNLNFDTNQEATQFRDIEKQVFDYLEKLSDYIRKTHGERSANKIMEIDELNYLDHSIRVNVGEISKAHNMQKAEIINNNYKENDLFDLFKMIKLLRVSDVLDIKKDRTYEILLKNNLSFMSDFSKFQWVGHLIVDSFEIKSEYKHEDNKIYEKIVLDISLNYDNKELVDNNLDINVKYDETNTGYQMGYSDNILIKSKKIPFVLKWFLRKNFYLFNELKLFEDNINVNNGIFKTKFVFNFNVNPKRILDGELLDIVSNNVKDKSIKG